MEPPRRKYSRRQLLCASGAAAAVVGVSSPMQAVGAELPVPKRRTAQRHVFGLRLPPLEKVRIGLIGAGSRGTSLLGNLLDIEGVEIRAVCDVVSGRVQDAQRRVTAKGQEEPAGYTKGEKHFEALCGRADLDVVYIATPWDWHVPMAVCAMKHGKHAAIEVPAAMTLDECWELVNTAEITRRHCFMLENCCYGEIELLILRMVKRGVLGELTHGEAGYLHEIQDYLLQDVASANWRRRFVASLNGNLYPTHGLGPVAQYLGIHAGDRFQTLVSMSSLERALTLRRQARAAGTPRSDERFACGDINTTLIKTALGRTIMVQYSLVQPRPYSRINLITGTSGTFCDYPPRLHLAGQKEDWITDLRPYHDAYGHPWWQRVRSQALKSGGHGGMDYVMNWRLIQCLREGLPLDLTVYDAAAWSSIVPLSIQSVSKGGTAVAVPDFTRSAWKYQPPGALAEG